MLVQTIQRTRSHRKTVRLWKCTEHSGSLFANYGAPAACANEACAYPMHARRRSGGVSPGR
jgi:hypothetical protein